MQETAGLVTFTEEILNGKLQFLCSVRYFERSKFSRSLVHKKIVGLLDSLQVRILVFSREIGYFFEFE